MADERKAKTMTLSGNEYAKVAERLKMFRTDFPHSKIETEHKSNEDGTVEFKAWIWKDKTDYLDVLKEVKDIKVARGTADADGNAKGETGKKVKDFEKLQTVAVGRALALLGYLGSGEIASFEEMEQFEEFRAQQKEQAVKDAIFTLEMAKTMDELKDAFVKSNLMQNPAVVAAKDKRKAELTPPPAKPAPRPTGGKKVETKPAEEPVAAALPLEEPADADN